MREAIMHEIKLNNCYCVTFREVVGNTEALSFHTYPTKHKALMGKSIFEYDEVWRKLAKL